MQSQIKLNTLREDSSSELFGRNHPPHSLRQLRSVRYAQHTPNYLFQLSGVSGKPNQFAHQEISSQKVDHVTRHPLSQIWRTYTTDRLTSRRKQSCSNQSCDFEGKRWLRQFRADMNVGCSIESPFHVYSESPTEWDRSRRRKSDFRRNLLHAEMFSETALILLWPTEPKLWHQIS